MTPLDIHEFREFTSPIYLLKINESKNQERRRLGSPGDDGPNPGKQQIEVPGRQLCRRHGEPPAQCGENGGSLGEKRLHAIGSLTMERLDTLEKIKTCKEEKRQLKTTGKIKSCTTKKRSDKKQSKIWHDESEENPLDLDVLEMLR